MIGERRSCDAPLKIHVPRSIRLGTFLTFHLPLPTRDGVGPSCTALPPGPWPTITEFLVERFPAISRATWLARMQAHEVVDEHGVEVTAARPYQRQLRVYYYRALDDEPVIPFTEVVLYRDDHLLVVDKPHFLPVTPSGKYLQQTLLVRLKRRLGIDALTPIHRIDRETAGLVLFSVQVGTRARYTGLFAQRGVVKHYEAVVHWPQPTTGFVLPAVYRSRLVQDDFFLRTREVPGEANSETHLQLVEERGNRARLRLSPVTGRKHQLRVQCAAMGIAILNDRFYPTLLAAADDDHACPLQLLAKSLAFTDPLTGERRSFTSARSLSLA